jgi:hypothetical protein
VIVIVFDMAGRQEMEGKIIDGGKNLAGRRWLC